MKIQMCRDRSDTFALIAPLYKLHTSMHIDESDIEEGFAFLFAIGNFEDADMVYPHLEHTSPNQIWRRRAISRSQDAQLYLTVDRNSICTLSMRLGKESVDSGSLELLTNPRFQPFRLRRKKRFFLARGIAYRRS
jgi:hypothetical protein